ncbi:RND efflux system, outer membrane lipoprotein, NodT family [Acidisarcina polymorpha]|uniref:RND efflux system, outer membrane lipoprotein, NodT family n=1 Tax=Acidisarcina polymorpha TaxID=2211140 RepID=A0A2Z5G1T1_9BACT|nr:efflux transporter outer membrane subunit [Acidisarcina polymorpha]AXC12605.1 RND efflux system, outer membrane lipoprotein, NodT family [Acidisarcina polymorpha]
MSKSADHLFHSRSSDEMADDHKEIRAWVLRISLVAIVLLVAGCNVGPDYKRPVVNNPQSYRGALAPDIAATPGRTNAAPAVSLADQQWSTIFKDPVLQRLVEEALKNNLDLRIAAQRILEAQAQVGITRSQQLPSVNAGGSYSALQLPSGLAFANTSGAPTSSFISGGGFSASGAWNLDFWGLYRRQTEAARADLLSTEWAQKATRSALVEGVAEAYFQLRSLDAQLEVTNRTIQARKDSLKLVSELEKYGAGSLEDTRQAEELLHSAQAVLPQIRQQIAVEENTISILLGHNPDAVDRGLPVDQQPHPEEVPAGVPSQLLERRPDIQVAEAKLIAANARIGVAKAQFFPNISLSSLGGSASNQLQSVFSGKNAYWYAAASLSEPIFDGGRIRSNYHLSQAEEQEMLLEYQKTILNALRDVSNSLVAYKETREHREEKAAQVTAAADAVRLARMRYSGGNTSYLEVLTTDTDLYDAQLNLALAQEQEAASLVQLYAALGGGWQQ